MMNVIDAYTTYRVRTMQEDIIYMDVCISMTSNGEMRSERA